MSSFKAFFCGVVISAVAGLAPTAALADTNTNRCIADLGGIRVCQDRHFLGLPKDLQGCCDGVRRLAADRCECNPALDVLLGVEGKRIYDLEPLCRFVQPAKWWAVRPRFARSCTPLQTHQYGCGMTDMQMDAARLKTIFAFQSAFNTFAANEAMCLETPTFAERLAAVFTPDADLVVPYGAGTYTGPVEIAEYLGLTSPSLNHAFWTNDNKPDPTKRARLEVSANGSTWITANTNRGDFLRGRLPYADAYLEQELSFQGCDPLVSKYNVVPTDGFRFLIERFVQGSDWSKRWGLEDICRYHTRFCADDPATRQYDSEEACLDYLGGLPLYTQACGPNRPLSGHSIGCKFKHHFMIPADPKLHCPHIGPLGSHDPNHKLKCDDVAECSEDQGQDAWPPILAIGANTPQDVVEAFEQSNIGHETEPQGCAIPTMEDEQEHPH